MSFKDLLKKSKEEKRAIGSFNVYNYETIKGVIETGQELVKPMIVSFGEIYLKNMSFDVVASIVKSLDKELDIPIVLHLDHANSIENIRSALEAGFTSIMYDGSTLPFEENIANTKKVVAMAKEFNASVEAELGTIGAGTNSNEGGVETAKYTDPKDAKRFVGETGVDALAVSIGTVHGMYKGEPDIRIDILKEINEAVDIPLVLHGGSGTPEEIIKEAIRNGIAKINVNTEISKYVVENVAEFIDLNKTTHLSEVSLKEIEWVKDICKKYTELFNS